MNNYDMGGGRSIRANNDINEINKITTNMKSKCLEMTSTSTDTGDISAPKIYTKTEVNQLLTGARLHLI